jgi:hypothetical protein
VTAASIATHRLRAAYWTRIFILQGHHKALLIATAILGLGLVSLAKASKIAGKIVAYDLMRHNSKTASFMQNQEIVILETGREKEKYAKIIFSSFDTSQIDPKYFDGTLPLEVDILRDHSCDERSPVFVTQPSLERIAGTYLLTDAFKKHPPASIKTLKCYAAIYKKK